MAGSELPFKYLSFRYVCVCVCVCVFVWHLWVAKNKNKIKQEQHTLYQQKLMEFNIFVPILMDMNCWTVLYVWY